MYHLWYTDSTACGVPPSWDGDGGVQQGKPYQTYRQPPYCLGRARKRRTKQAHVATPRHLPGGLLGLLSLLGLEGCHLLGSSLDQLRAALEHLVVIEQAEGELLVSSDDAPANSLKDCLLYTSPSPRDQRGSRMPSSA